MFIDSREVSVSSPVLVIAEIGVNHDGSLDRALQLVECAKQAGADAVKLQIFRADALMNAASAFAQYQADRCRESTPSDMLRRYELSFEQCQRIVRAIREAGMLPLATPFSIPDLQTIRRLDLPAIKIASPDLVNRPLLREAAGLGRPILLSTGASTLDEIDRTVGWLRELDATFSLLHCISAYPAAGQDANLCWITELQQRSGAPAGYSDHTTDLLSGALAVAAGAGIIEKHLTYDRTASGPDHAASADPAQFTQYIRMIRQAQVLRGRPGRRVLDAEQDVRRVSRQSLVLRHALDAGEVLRDDHLAIQRPGTGISAADFHRVIGRKLQTAAAAGQLLRWEMLAA